MQAIWCALFSVFLLELVQNGLDKSISNKCTSTAFGLQDWRIEDSQMTALSSQKISSIETDPKCVRQGISFWAGCAPPINGQYIQRDFGQEFAVGLSSNYYYVTSGNIPRSTNRGTRSIFLLVMRGNQDGSLIVRDTFIVLMYEWNISLQPLAYDATSVKTVGPRSAPAAIQMANDDHKKRHFITSRLDATRPRSAPAAVQMANDDYKKRHFITLWTNATRPRSAPAAVQIANDDSKTSWLNVTRPRPDPEPIVMGVGHVANDDYKKRLFKILIFSFAIAGLFLVFHILTIYGYFVYNILAAWGNW